MLHLSLLHLPRSLPRWRQCDPYQAHQLAWKAFPGVPHGERPFLFSLDERGGHHSLLVQSTTAPDWSFLDGSARVQTKTFDPGRIPEATPLKFFLRANPTVDRQGYQSGKQRIGVGLNPRLVFERMGRPHDAPRSPEEVAAWRREELIGWLTRQADRHGFVVERCEPGPIVARRVIRDPKARQATMTFHEVEFTGTLQVADTNTFGAACARGVGRGRAFGYGLLMVRPG
jgi:CRISPR system Cascade subunit CasE